MEDTICAIATALSKSSIGIIKVSGDDAINIVDKICDIDLISRESHTINYAFIKDADEIIDEVMIMLMKAPKTYTKEDVIEINCHGSIITINKILSLLIKKGARLAEPGEFTKRAYLNGRINLLEATSVMDLIDSTSAKANKLALNGVVKKTASLINNLRDKIIKILASIEVNIDYPEYEDELLYTHNLLNSDLVIIKDSVKKILKDSKTGELIKNGISVGLIGKPNVGKSSILNGLLGTKKAIVTDIAGTTRDSIESEFVLNGVLFKLIDTAGIRKTDDIVEKLGIEKSIDISNNCEFVIYILNKNEKVTKEDIEFLENRSNYLLIVNKDDLDNNLGYDISKYNPIYISALENDGISKIKEELEKRFLLNELDNDDLIYITSTHNISMLEEILEIIENIENSILYGTPVDLISIDLNLIYTKLGNILGEVYEDDLVDALFSNFCLGK